MTRHMRLKRSIRAKIRLGKIRGNRKARVARRLAK